MGAKRPESLEKNKKLKQKYPVPRKNTTENKRLDV